MALGTGAALLLGTAASTVGGIASANKQASVAQDAADQNIAFQREVYQDQMGRSQPYYDAGVNALRRYSESLSVPFEESEDYRFRRDQGLNALEAASRASGMNLSGAALKDAYQFADGVAAQGRSEYQNRRAALAGVGQAATGQMDASGNAFANGAGNALMYGANAQANAIGGVNNAFQTGLSSGFNTLGMAHAGYFGDDFGFGSLFSGKGNSPLITKRDSLRAI